MTESTKSVLTPINLVYLLAPPLFWAGNAVIGRAMAAELAPMALSFWRWALAFLIILPFTAKALWQAREEIRRRWGMILICSMAGVGAYNSFQYLALQTSTALNVTLIASASPVFILLFGAMFFKSPVSGRQWLGALLSIIGVLWVVGRGDLDKVFAFHLSPGDIYILVAIAIWSIYTWLLRTRRPALAAAPFLAIQIGLGALVILPFYLVEHALTGRTITLTGPVIATFAYIGLLPSLAAYFCWDRAVARTGAALPGYFVNLTPIFAALLAVVFLDETIALYHLMGALFIFAGIALASLPAKARTS